MSDTDANLSPVFEALVYAGRVHNGQRRRDAPGSPHLKHVMQVVSLLFGAGIRDPQILTAAAVHDVLRDTEVQVEELQEKFGAEVTGIVAELSADSVLSRVDRQVELPLRVREFSDPAQLIKLAEKISNLRDLAEDAPIGWSRQRRRDYFDWAEGVTRPLRGASSKLDSELDEALKLRP